MIDDPGLLTRDADLLVERATQTKATLAVILAPLQAQLADALRRIEYLERHAPPRMEPCPACGSEVVAVGGTSAHAEIPKLYGYCQSCFGDCRPRVEGPVCTTKPDAIAAWNEWAKGEMK